MPSATTDRGPVPPPAPVPESERIRALDVLRGFAVLGILTMNIGSFAMPSAAYFNPSAWGDLSGLNGWIWRLTHVLGDLKFMAIFSMLFGAGMVLMSERREARGAGSWGLHLRRMGWLIAFGAAHAYLLWYGDILVWYGVTGVLLYGFRRRSPGVLLALALVFWLIGSGVLWGAGVSFASWPDEVRADIVAELDPDPAALAAEVEVYRSGWVEQMRSRVPSAVEMHTATYASWAVWRVGGLMLLGMGLFKLGVLSARAPPRTYGAFIVGALIVGLPVIVVGMQRNMAIEWAAPDFFFPGSLYNYWGSLPVALGWVGVVMLVCRGSVLRGLTDRLAAVGRMAFTNYIAQTVICTTIFYGHGFGLFGRVDRAGQAAVMLGVWAFLLIASPLWLARFRYGPLEWLWRTLVYLQRQPFRRAG